MKKKLFALVLALGILLCGCQVTIHLNPTQSAPGLDPDSTGDGILNVHYIDVGQADCALLETDGKYVLIDGGNKEDSQLVISYLQQQGVQELEAVICTHAHEDHVGGLPAVLAVSPPRLSTPPRKPILPRSTTISCTTWTSRVWRSPSPSPATA